MCGFARRRWPGLVLLVVLVAGGGFLVWAGTPARPMPEALAALVTDKQVRVTTGPWLTFEPAAAAGPPPVGLVIYPGGRVDARAYAPLARELARQGYLTVIVKMPLDLAVFAPERAGAVMAAYPDVQAWAIGGHSLGGAMAARFAYRNPQAVAGLVLWAAYPAASDDLSGRDLAVTSIYGTLDGLATLDKIEASRPLLPPGTVWRPLDGANHAQFGYYGAQARDNAATIDRAEQQAAVIRATAALLALITPR